jgi:hypothetical protein
MIQTNKQTYCRLECYAISGWRRCIYAVFSGDGADRHIFTAVLVERRVVFPETWRNYLSGSTYSRRWSGASGA